MERKKILIFPAGSEIAFEILRALQDSKFVEIYGGTSVEDHSAYVYKNLITGFPNVDQTNFIEFLNNVVQQYGIEYIYPAHDSVCLLLSQHLDDIDAEVIITNPKTVDICRSKEKTYDFLKGESFIPYTYKNEVDVKTYPVFVKPKVGQGSVGAKKVNTTEELKMALEENPDVVICEYLSGEEFTVDCFTDKTGVLRVVKQRTRERIRAGIAVKSKEVTVDEKVRQIAQTINQKLAFRGAWFFQLKMTSTGEYKLLEISPRIPGTMGLSRNTGINFPLLTLFDFWGYDVDILENQYEISLDRAFYSAYKIDYEYEHVYLDYDDTLVFGDRVNKLLIVLLYQFLEEGKHIHLITKHVGDIYEDLENHKIVPSLFEDIIVLDKQEKKIDYIKHKKAIFIDDSFAERKAVHEVCNIPVFDVDMLECLINWKK